MESLLAKQFHRSIKVFIFTWNENWNRCWGRINLKLYRVHRNVVKSGCFLVQRRSLLNSCGGASLNGTQCFCRWIRDESYSISANAGKRATWRLVLLRLMKCVIAKDMSWNCLKVERRKSFLSFESFQAKFHSLLCIFWYSSFLHFQDFRFSFFFNFCGYAFENPYG